MRTSYYLNRQKYLDLSDEEICDIIPDATDEELCAISDILDERRLPGDNIIAAVLVATDFDIAEVQARTGYDYHRIRQVYFRALQDKYGKKNI
jgi:hypothetical protein